MVESGYGKTREFAIVSPGSAASYGIVAKKILLLPSVYRGRRRVAKLLCEGEFSGGCQKICV